MVKRLPRCLPIQYALASSRCVLLTFDLDMQTSELELSSGVIWVALNVDYPGHSFSHLGIYHGNRDSFIKLDNTNNNCQRV